MSRIVTVDIKGLWGVKNISTTFHPDVNVFIGLNGSSKTTFLNLIEGALLVDIKMLSRITFKSLSIQIDNSDIFHIEVSKGSREDFQIILFTLNKSETYEIPNIELRHSYRMGAIREIIESLRSKLNASINISWLSVYRDRDSFQDNNENSHGLNNDFNVVDAKLRYLMQKLLMYRFQLESELNKISDKFKEDVFSIMLYNKEYDCVDFNKFQTFQSIDSRQLKSELYRVFRKLGIVKDKKADIDAHMGALSAVIDKIFKREQLGLEDLLPISLLNRTLSLIEISKVDELAKDQVNAPINKYIKCLNQFIPDKNFEIQDGKEGLVIIVKDPLRQLMKSDIRIPVSALSSGEKQLLILLTETLLQQERNYLFIADEPELSLHIEWQRKIILSIHELNPNAQIIVATHSPEIAGLWSNRVINMSNISTTYYATE